MKLYLSYVLSSPVLISTNTYLEAVMCADTRMYIYVRITANISVQANAHVITIL